MSEDTSRLMKAMRFADILGPLCRDALANSNDETVPQLAQRLPDECWLKADEKIRVATGRKSPNKLPSDQTKAMTIAILEEREEAHLENQARVDRLWDTVEGDPSKVPALEEQMYGGAA